MRTCIWNGCLFDRFCILKELWQIRFWDKLKLMQCLHELSNFVNDLLWWRCLDFLKFCCCSHVKLLRLRKKNTLQRIMCPFWCRPDLFDKLDETPCFSHLLPMNIQLPFISHSLFKLFFTSKRLGVGGSAADGMAAAAPVRTTRQSLKVLYRGCKEVVRKHVQQLIAVNIRFLDTYKHHQDATCQNPDKKKPVVLFSSRACLKGNRRVFRCLQGLLICHFECGAAAAWDQWRPRKDAWHHAGASEISLNSAPWLQIPNLNYTSQRRIKGWLDKSIYPWEMSEDFGNISNVWDDIHFEFFFSGKKHQSYKCFRVCWKCSYSLMAGQLCCSLVDSLDNESIKLCFTQRFANVDKQHQAWLAIWWECLYCNATHFAVWRMDDSYWTTANFEITADSFESCEP